jgi:hypothetical protein
MGFEVPESWASARLQDCNHAVRHSPGKDELSGVVVTSAQDGGDFQPQNLPSEAFPQWSSGLMLLKSDHFPPLFSLIKSFGTREYISGAISLGPNCFVRDRHHGVEKLDSRSLPTARILVFPGFAFGRHVSMILFLSCLLFSNSPFAFYNGCSSSNSHALDKRWLQSPANCRLESHR